MESSEEEEFVPSEKEDPNEESDLDHEEEEEKKPTKRAKIISKEKKEEKLVDKEKIDSVWQKMKNEPSVIKVTEKVQFAGEIIEIAKEVPSNTKLIKETPSITQPKKKGNLDSLLAGLKPKKISTTQKSALDWEKFKKQEGIQEELSKHAKDGYLQKQAFLQRTDLRQFERERDIRQAKRKNS